LSSVNLRYADLEEADLQGANLRGADLRGVKGFSKEYFKTAIFDKTTKLPEYLK
jgi:uncharacterized protein YjbI with pentapeptide repeats